MKINITQLHINIINFLQNDKINKKKNILEFVKICKLFLIFLNEEYRFNSAISSKKFRFSPIILESDQLQINSKRVSRLALFLLISARDLIDTLLAATPSELPNWQDVGMEVGIHVPFDRFVNVEFITLEQTSWRNWRE